MRKSSPTRGNAISMAVIRMFITLSSYIFVGHELPSHRQLASIYVMLSRQQFSALYRCIL